MIHAVLVTNSRSSPLHNLFSVVSTIPLLLYLHVSRRGNLQNSGAIPHSSTHWNKKFLIMKLSQSPYRQTSKQQDFKNVRFYLVLW